MLPKLCPTVMLAVCTTPGSVDTMCASSVTKSITQGINEMDPPLCGAAVISHNEVSASALSANLLHGFGRFMLSNERPAPVRCCNAS